MIGRVLRDKGLNELAEAARLIREKGVLNFRVLVLGEVGADNPTAIPQRTVSEWERSGLIEHVAPVKDVRPLIADAHCVVLPSYREGVPRSLLEAAGMARPLIATDVPGCREVIDHEVNGLLCEPRSAPSLAAAMERMMEFPPETRARMGNASRALVEDRFEQARVSNIYWAEIFQ